MASPVLIPRTPADFAPMSARMAASLQLWLLNLAVAAFIALGYLQRAPEDLSPRGIAFLALGFLSSLGMLSLVPATLALVFAFFHGSAGVLGRRLGLLWTLALALLYADTRIYGIFQFHLNAVVWNGLTTPGAGEAIHPGFGDVILPAFAVIGIITCQARIFRWLLRHCARRAEERRHKHSFGPGVVGFAALLLAFVTERQLYAQDVEEGGQELASLSELLPYYQLPATMMRKLRDEPPTAGEIVFAIEERDLHWPSQALSVEAGGSRPNVLVLVLDGLRADMLAPKTMPRTWAFSQDARVFEDHWSGGNCTRHGVFSLLYGLPGNYWAPVLRTQQTPVMLDTLLDQGYEPRVICSTAQSFPEFRSTAWAAIPDAIEDTFQGEAWQKDLQVAARFGDWLDAREDPSRPFFAFSLLDGTHANYSFPEDDVYFEPSTDAVGYIKLSYGLEADDRDALFNRYRNAVRHTDAVVGQILHHLSKRGLLDNTLVVITGDHGEEFFENGYWGHHSNFTKEQVSVPFVMRGPGVAVGVETRASSHVDFSRTVLEMIGVPAAQAKHYATGANLLALPEERTIISSSWSSMAIRLANRGALVISDYADDLPLRAFGPDGKPVNHENDVLRREASKLEEVLALCHRFLRAE
jgi:uncharacterized protein